jgi:hypothetical protein
LRNAGSVRSADGKACCSAELASKFSASGAFPIKSDTFAVREGFAEQGRSMKTVQPGDRTLVLHTVRNRKMAKSVESFVRGSTDQFYQWLQTSGPLPQGPNVWICGDCHVGNLGPVASKSGKLAIQIRDFDQTVIGNPAHDLIRLALSLAMAARSSDLPGITTALMLERIMDGYGSAFSPMMDEEAFDDAAIVPDTVKLVMHEANSNPWRRLADGQVDGDKPVLPLGARFWPLTPD